VAHRHLTVPVHLSFRRREDQDARPGRNVDPGADTRELLRRWHADGDAHARAVVAERMLPLAHGLARRYSGRGEPLDDLEQVACVGLLKAIDRFDPARGAKFTTFAVPTIAGELKRHFRDRGWMLRVPRDVQELTARLASAREALTSELGRAPRVEELARDAGASVERAVEAMNAADAYRTQSLDEPRVDGAEPAAALACADEGFERAEERFMLERGLGALAPREREILRLRFAEGLTQREIAAAVGLSQMHVSRLIRRSVAALRLSLEPLAEAA
jgi:RNA polymerase sigma-B factor